MSRPSSIHTLPSCNWQRCPTDQRVKCAAAKAAAGEAAGPTTLYIPRCYWRRCHRCHWRCHWHRRHLASFIPSACDALLQSQAGNPSLSAEEGACPAGGTNGAHPVQGLAQLLLHKLRYVADRSIDGGTDRPGLLSAHNVCAPG